MTVLMPHGWRRLRHAKTAALTRPLAMDHWVVPGVVEVQAFRRQWEDGRISATEPWLVWQLMSAVKGKAVKDARRVTTRPRLLESFLALHDQPDAAILRYARRWGPLYLCREHRLPASHRVHVPGFAMGWEDAACEPLRVGPWDGAETLAEWRLYVERARGLLDLAGALHADQRPQSHHWEAALRAWRTPGNSPNGRSFSVPWWRRSIPADRRVFVDLLNEWLRLGGVRPTVQWSDEDARVVLGAPSLAGALAVQLALAVTRSDGLAICSACGQAFSQGRQRDPARRRYCETCRAAGAPLRDAQRARRRRLRREM